MDEQIKDFKKIVKNNRLTGAHKPSNIKTLKLLRSILFA